jgi:hypothetical protein
MLLDRTYAGFNPFTMRGIQYYTQACQIPFMPEHRAMCICGAPKPTNQLGGSNFDGLRPKLVPAKFRHIKQAQHNRRHFRRAQNAHITGLQSYVNRATRESKSQQLRYMLSVNGHRQCG